MKTSRAVFAAVRHTGNVEGGERESEKEGGERETDQSH